MNTVDSWTLARLREAKAYRDANPDPQWAEADAYWDSVLARAEQAYVRHESPVADPEPAARPSNPTGAANCNSRPSTASEKQLGFIASLCQRLGLDPADYAPRDKSHASLIIGSLKKRVDAAPVAAAKPVGRPATERQVEYVGDLMANRQWELLADELAIPEDLTTLTAARASLLIDELRTLPRRKKGSAPAHGIRTGRYAWRDAEGVVHFYVVDRNGKIWVQAGPARHPYSGRLNEALEAIRADPKTAAALYGQELGHCGRCGLELTDEDSRQRGLGPICAGKTEW